MPHELSTKSVPASKSTSGCVSGKFFAELSSFGDVFLISFYGVLSSFSTFEASEISSISLSSFPPPLVITFDFSG